MSYQCGGTGCLGCSDCGVQRPPPRDMETHLLGIDIHDCDPRHHREGLVVCVTPTQLWVLWLETGRHRWISRSRVHHDKSKRSGYYVAPLEVS